MTPIERGKAIDARDGGEIKRLLTQAIPAAMRSHATPERKYIRLVEISRQVIDLIEPFTPCRRGCSHCCNMAVSISAHEAESIAKHAGLTPSVPPRSFPTDDEKLEILQEASFNVERAAALWAEKRYWRKYTGVPCTFLKNNECSIYDVRPLACRVHHVLEDDNKKCDIAAGVQTISAVDLGEFDNALAYLFPDGSWGDIREFFPTT